MSRQHRGCHDHQWSLLGGRGRTRSTSDGQGSQPGGEISRMIPPNPILGSALHAVGAFLAAICYTPQKRVNGWSWQSYWMVQAAFCWFLLPILGAWLTIPELGAVLREAPRSAMLASFLLGAAYGIGGTAFGVSIRYIGFSLTYAIAIGLSTVLGPLIPPLVKGTLATTLSKPGASWVVAGIAIGMVGIALTG